MRFPGNCLCVAGLAWLGGYDIAMVRNRSGRLHFFWRDADGLAFEFYRQGASRRSYLQNALYVGAIRRAPSFDRVPVDA